MSDADLDVIDVIGRSAADSLRPPEARAGWAGEVARRGRRRRTARRIAAVGVVAMIPVVALIGAVAGRDSAESVEIGGDPAVTTTTTRDGRVGVVGVVPDRESDVTVYIASTASEDDRGAVRDAAASLSGFVAGSARDRQAVLDRVQRIAPRVAEALEVTELPSAFDIWLRTGDDTEAAFAAFAQNLAVIEVVRSGSGFVGTGEVDEAQVSDACAGMDPAAVHFGPTVYLQPAATDDQIAAVRAELESSPYVAAVRYIDHDATLARFRRLFAADPTMVDAAQVDRLPTSFEVDMVPGADPMLVETGTALSSVAPIYSVKMPSLSLAGLARLCGVAG